jgi:hypothetical protein
MLRVILIVGLLLAAGCAKEIHEASAPPAWSNHSF